MDERELERECDAMAEGLCHKFWPNDEPWIGLAKAMSLALQLQYTNGKLAGVQESYDSFVHITSSK